MAAIIDVKRSLRSILGVLGAAIAAIAPRFLEAQSRPVRDGYLVTSDSARLYYRITGRGPDTLIAIHGGPGVDLESIAADFAPLAARHVVIFYDQRGSGRSELPADTTRLVAARQIADLDEVRRHFGFRRVTLVAHSYGPLLAASYALAHPAVVRAMVFFGPLPPRRGDFWQRFAAGMRQRLDSTATAQLSDANRRLNDPHADLLRACRDFWAIALKPRLAEPARTQALIRSDLCGSDPAGIRYGLTTTNRVVMASYGDWDLRDRLRHLEVPTLIVHGEEEVIPMDLVEEWAAALPHARLLRVPRAAHFTYVERPDLVWPAVERFLAAPSPPEGAASPVREATAVFAGGCFWGVEAVFEHLRGVLSATSGYSGGDVVSPTYEQVGTGRTGHAESVRVVFDPAVISYRQLLEVFFTVAHDPTQRDHQGPDSGPDYRAIVFYQDPAQRRMAEDYVAELGRAKAFPKPIVTEIRPLKAFYPAEAYHQDFAARNPSNPYIVANDLPKLDHLRKAFPALYQEPEAR